VGEADFVVAKAQQAGETAGGVEIVIDNKDAGAGSVGGAGGW